MNVIQKRIWTAALSLTGAAIMLVATGCASHPYYAPPPPPPPYAQRPPLIDLADHNGFRAGTDDGSRDAYNGRGYRPQHDRNFRDTPGYDPALGPFEPYRSAFRDAYLRGTTTDSGGSSNPHNSFRSPCIPLLRSHPRGSGNLLQFRQDYRRSRCP